MGFKFGSVLAGSVVWLDSEMLNSGFGFLGLDMNQHPFGGTNTRIELWN